MLKDLFIKTTHQKVRRGIDWMRYESYFQFPHFDPLQTTSDEVILKKDYIYIKMESKIYNVYKPPFHIRSLVFYV